MMYFSEAGYLDRSIMLIALVMNVLFALGIVFLNLMGKKNHIRIVVNCTLLITTMIIYFGLISINNNYQSFPYFLEAMNQKIWRVWIFVIICFIYFSIEGLIELKRYNRSINRNSVKEALDNLPLGICFSNYRGQIILINRTMYNLCSTIIGKSFRNLTEVKEGLLYPDHNVICLDSEMSIYMFPDGCVWRFGESYVQDEEGNRYTQLFAADITTFYLTKKELEKEHAKLKKTSNRIKNMIKNINDLTREEEILSLKMRVHHDLGESIIATKKILTEDQLLLHSDEVIRYWKNSVNLLKNVNDQPEDKDMLLELMEAAKGIGIDIIIKGELPSDQKIAYLIVTAIRECTTNIARHTDGNELHAVIKVEERRARVFITNNGKAPEMEIIEGGGLSSLRKKIENAGGIMALQSMPEFRLVITLPLESEGFKW